MSEIRIQPSIRVAQTQQKQAINNQDDVQTQVQTQTPALKPKTADEVLNFMSNSAVITNTTDKTDTAKAKKSIEVSKYISPEQATRIGNSVNAFFAGMEKHVETAMKEFNLTAPQAQNLVSAGFNQKFNDEDTAIIASGQRFIST